MKLDVKVTLFILAVLSVLVLVHVAKDGQPDVVLLGQTTLLSPIAKPKFIHVGACSRKTFQFTAVQAQSLGDEMIIDELNLHYGGGVWEQVNIKEQIPRGKTTNWLDLRGNKCIEDIEVVARTREGAYSLAKIWAQR